MPEGERGGFIIRTSAADAARRTILQTDIDYLAQALGARSSSGSQVAPAHVAAVPGPGLAQRMLRDICLGVHDRDPDRFERSNWQAIGSSRAPHAGHDRQRCA
jgi:hypothetical protein